MAARGTLAASGPGSNPGSPARVSVRSAHANICSCRRGTPRQRLREVDRRARARSREVLRHFGLRPAGGNHRHAAQLRSRRGRSRPTTSIPTTRAPRARGASACRSTEVLVEQLDVLSRGQLKRAALRGRASRRRRCEICGQGEQWRGRRMALILDHINGVARRQPAREPADRLPELRRDARHALRRARTAPLRRARVPPLRRAVPPERPPAAVLLAALRRSAGTDAGRRARRSAGCERPPYEQLLAEVAATSWSAVGRKYGVSRQRGAQVGAGVRARTRRVRAASMPSRIRPL